MEDEDEEKEREKVLKPMEKRFADRFLETGNITQSYIDAGFEIKNRRNAYERGKRLLSLYAVKNYIEEFTKGLDEEKIAGPEEVLEHLSSIARAKKKEEVLFLTEGEVIRAEKTPAIKEQVKSLELLGKRYLLFTDKHTHDHNHVVEFIEDIPADDNE